jgi:hypothetical protein
VLKVNTFSPLQVKNKPRDRETEYAFTLSSMDRTVAKNDYRNFVANIYFLIQLILRNVLDQYLVKDFQERNMVLFDFSINGKRICLFVMVFCVPHSLDFFFKHLTAAPTPLLLPLRM